MLTKFCCFGQSMDFADNAKYVKRVLLLFSSSTLFHLSSPAQGLACIQANAGYAAWSARAIVLPILLQAAVVYCRPACLEDMDMQTHSLGMSEQADDQVCCSLGAGPGLCATSNAIPKAST